MKFLLISVTFIALFLAHETIVHRRIAIVTSLAEQASAREIIAALGDPNTVKIQPPEQLFYSSPYRSSASKQYTAADRA